MSKQPDSSALTDAELIKLARENKDNRAIDTLFIRLNPWVRGVIYNVLSGSSSFYMSRITAGHETKRRKKGEKSSFTVYIQQEINDLFDDVWLKMTKNLRSYDPAKGAFKPWFAKLIRNVINDYWKGRNAAPLPMDEENFKKVEEKHNCRYDLGYLAAEKVVFEEARRIALDSISAIENEDYRTAFFIRVTMFGVFSEDELADLLGRQSGTFRSDVSRGREEWESILTKKMSPDIIEGILNYYQKGGGVVMDRLEMLEKIRDERARAAFDLRLKLGQDYEAIAKELKCEADEAKDLISSALNFLVEDRKVRGSATPDTGSLPEDLKNTVFFETIDNLSRGIDLSARPTRSRPGFAREQLAAKLLYYVLNGPPAKTQTLGNLLSKLAKEKKKDFTAIAKGSGMSVDEFAGILSGAKKPGKEDLAKLAKSLGVPAKDLDKASKASAAKTAARATRGAGSLLPDWEKIEQKTLKKMHAVLDKERKLG